MPKEIPDHEFTAIITIISAHAEGVTAAVIRDALTYSISPRMLQRRLARLAEQHRIIIRGTGKGSRYFPMPEGTSENGVKVENAIPLSTEAQMLRDAVGRPVESRTPAGYQREFLERYIPNETFYLSKKIRLHLLEKGQAANHDEPAGTYVRSIFHRLLIDLSWNSSRLEGNTYSLLETERLLNIGEAAEGKNARETQMILNHKAAIEMLVESTAEVPFNRYTILNLHALLSDNLLDDQQACGRLRTIPVGIGGTVFYPLDAPQLLIECFDTLLHKCSKISDPFEQSFFTLIHLPYLQPFEDVNKRVSRLAANIPLIAGNLCPLSFIDVPKQLYVDAMVAVYELNRPELLRDLFIWAYERSCARYSAVRRSLGEPNPFRLRYRTNISEVVSATVRGRLNKQEAIRLIRHFAAEQVPTEDAPHFIEMAEMELMTLHEGNIARYRLRPSEFEAWQQMWR